MKKMLQILPVGLLLAMNAAYADCSRPDAPAMPDGATSSEAELAATQTSVKEYMAQTNVYLECLAQEEAKAPEDEAPQAASARIAAHNQAVDDMEVVAEQINGAVRAWKARSAEE